MQAYKVVLALIGLIGLALSSVALAYPSNTRYGYANCTSCHVSPSGGGVLNLYGRNSASEVLSTWAEPNEEEPGHGFLHELIPENPPVLVGGDVRYISLSQRYPGGILGKSFFMQADVEVAVPLTPGVVAVVSGGQYAKNLDGDAELAMRRYYLLMALNEKFSVRAGKFFPAYGLMIEDHTAATRQGLGFNENHETYNFEAVAKNQRGEISVTTMATSSGVNPVTVSDSGIIADQNGIVARATAYLGRASQVGFSGLYIKTITPGSAAQRVAFGPFVNIGFTSSVYLMAEVDTQHKDKDPPKIYSYSLLGYELFKGFHIGATYERVVSQDRAGAKLQWFPRPHFEITGAYSRSYSGLGTNAGPVFLSDTATILAHYYL